MARPEEHLAELLRLPPDERAKAARALLESLDEGSDSDAQEVQAEELVRRVTAFEAGKMSTVSLDEVRSRVLARLKSVRRRNK